jgi:hypothetical protein
MIKNLTEQYILIFSNKDLNAIPILLADDLVIEGPVLNTLQVKLLYLKQFPIFLRVEVGLTFFAKKYLS